MLHTPIGVSSSKGIILSYKPLVEAKSLLIIDDVVASYSDSNKLCRLAEELGGVCIETSDYIVPAFIDPHVHPESLGFETEISITMEIKNRYELYEALRKNPIYVGEWILARFDHLLYSDCKPPTRRELDDIFPDKPVLLIHRSGHFGVLNTIGLRIASSHSGIGGGIDYENGFVFEKDLMLIREYVLNRAGDEFMIKLLDKAIEQFVLNGVLTIGVAGCDTKLLNNLKTMDVKGNLLLRTYVYMILDKIDIKEIVREYVLSRLMYRKLRVNGVKVILDGALGPRTAYLSKPYSDEPTNNGVLLINRDDLYRIAMSVNEYGLQIAIHAIGDAALDIVLDVFEHLGTDVEKLQHRIEHASIVRDDQLEKINKLKPILVVQPHFILSDIWIHERVGEDRLKYVYRFKTLSNITTLAFSTDAPVEPVNPWRTIYAAACRGAYESLPIYKHTMSEKMNIIEALHSYTKLAGLALRDNRLGTLLPGCYADFIIVDKNPIEIREPRDLLDIRVLGNSIKIIKELTKN
ncbi:MAG: amidohydrolase [Desulfurococcaceae archaeon]